MAHRRRVEPETGTNGGGRNFNLIAVSKTSDPPGAFVVLSYDVTDDGMNGTPNHAGCPCFGDQPLLGFDAYGPLGRLLGRRVRRQQCVVCD